VRRILIVDDEENIRLVLRTLLRRHGYEVPIHGDLDKATRNVVRVFQMRYRPAKFDGVPDAETAAILDALVNP